MKHRNYIKCIRSLFSLQEKSFHVILSMIDRLRHRKKNRLGQKKKKTGAKKKKKNYARIVSNTITTMHLQINRKHYILLQENSGIYIDYDNFFRDVISIISLR